MYPLNKKLIRRNKSLVANIEIKGLLFFRIEFYQRELQLLDCPRIHLIRDGKFKKISKFEKKQYQDIKGVDQLFVLKVDPEIAIKRRLSDDNQDELRFRSWPNLEQ